FGTQNSTFTTRVTKLSMYSSIGSWRNKRRNLLSIIIIIHASIGHVACYAIICLVG
ncbi:hypothetical protein L9F63_022258, partial [Diploptera punctata]